MPGGAIGARRIALAVVGTAVSVVGVAACRSAAGGASPADSQVHNHTTTAVQAANWTAACRSAPEATRLLVSRIGVGQPQRPAPRAPAKATVTSIAAVRQAERALCALPRRPPGIYHCPADFGPSYSLRFWVGALALPTVTVRPTGCEIVGGMPGSVRWTARSPQFWRTLGQALGVTRPSAATFSGQPAEG